MNTDTITWVTSFSEKIFEVSGIHLIESFYNTKTDGSLFSYDDITIEKQQNYSEWFKSIEHVVPDHFGGKASPCTCRKPFSRQDKDHIKGCRYSWWNRNVIRWAKKIFSLNNIIQNKSTQFTIWIDADCVFNQYISLSEINQWFNGADIFYFKGPYRQIEETGIVGYRTDKPEVVHFIKEYLKIYTSKEFLNLRRWDDCYVFQKLRLKTNNVKFIDLGRKITGVGDVIPNSIVGPYLTHDKGRHGRKLGIIQ